ncbi:MAG: class C beta-lactamase-related serine hydrolase [Betaproteobacteria bacterium]|nr:class C beta-lactamase-related serine hydrolase [Betaproteobacteria bacterium]
MTFWFFAPTRFVEADSGGCQQAVGRDFLPASLEDVRLSPGPLLKLNDALDAGTYDIRSLLIVRDCKIVFERYKDGIGREHNHTIYSVTKSITATLVGALLMQGKLKSVDLTLSELMSKPWWLPADDWKKAQRITLRNVMQMSSGLTYKHDPAGHPIYALNADRFAMALSPEFIAEPGIRFNYSDGDVSLTGAMVAAVSDKNLYAFAKDVLFEPLQISNYDWWFRDRSGRYPGGWGLRLRPMDMAKVGQLYLQNGEWNGRRVFGPEFRDLAWLPGVSKLYGLHWWIGSAPEAKGLPYFVAVGVKSQRIYVVPSLRLVAVLTASLPGIEERKVNGIVVGALVDAFDQKSAVDVSGTFAALAAVQKKGFRGETRVFQEDQDNPRRF